MLKKKDSLEVPNSASHENDCHDPLVDVKYLFLEPHLTRQLKGVLVSISHIVTIPTVGSQKTLNSYLLGVLLNLSASKIFSPLINSRVESYPSLM